MWEQNYEYCKNEFSEEVLHLTSINERFDNEPSIVRGVRVQYARLLTILTEQRDLAGRSNAWRDASLAITHLEDSCIRAVKSLYASM